MSWKKNSEIIYHDSVKMIKEFGSKNKGAGGLFGGSGRREMTLLSDIDIFYTSSQKSSLFNSLLQNKLSKYFKYPVDVVGCDYKHLKKFPLLNGTNYHSVYFLNEIYGSSEAVINLKKSQRNIFSLEEIRIREFINVLGNLKGYSENIKKGDKRFVKFCKNGTSFWVKIFQLAQLRWPELVGKNTEEMIEHICIFYKIPSRDAKKDWDLVMNERILQEKKYNNQEEYEADLKDADSFGNILNIFLSDTVKWIQQVVGVDNKNLEKLIFDCFNLKIKIEKSKNISIICNNVLSAIVLTDHKKINKLAIEYGKDWWVATNICLNKNVSAKTLDYLVFPPFKKTNFLWRTVRLYVGKNTNTSSNTLNKILKTKNLRDQDYDAAKTNLKNKKYEK